MEIDPSTRLGFQCLNDKVVNLRVADHDGFKVLSNVDLRKYNAASLKLQLPGQKLTARLFT
jgi:hypothetical protein